MMPTGSGNCMMGSVEAFSIAGVKWRKEVDCWVI
jgi:hypothetical protein